MEFMRNIKITIEFDGTNYCGWQIQPGLPTIQGELEKALQKLVQQKTAVIGAGRTDSGVHALAHIANFKTESPFPPEVFLRGLNRFLPLDIRIMRVAEVPLDFNSRFSAKYRKYRYSIATQRRAVNRLYSWYCKYPLNFEAMQQASNALLGVHDFQAFAKATPDLPHYRCEIISVDWEQNHSELIFEIKANRFLHNMVRIIVGTLVDIGRGHLPPDAMTEIIASEDRNRAGRTVPATGLFLVEVGY